MAKVNLDLSSKLDIICREGDSFELELDINNSDGSTFTLSEGSAVLFTIYNYDNKPIVICHLGTDELNYMPVLTSGFSSETEYTSNLTWFTAHEGSVKMAKACINLLNAENSDFHFSDVNSYIVKTGVTDNTIIDHISSIMPSDNGFIVKVRSCRFNLPKGNYTYDFNLVSGLEEKHLDMWHFKSAQTWLYGRFKVDKN